MHTLHGDSLAKEEHWRIVDKVSDIWGWTSGHGGSHGGRHRGGEGGRHIGDMVADIEVGTISQF